MKKKIFAGAILLMIVAILALVFSPLAMKAQRGQPAGGSIAIDAIFPDGGIYRLDVPGLNVDISGVRPKLHLGVSTGTSFPACQQVGQAFIRTDETAGNNLYFCSSVSANTWTKYPLASPSFTALTSATLSSTTNCASAASPAVCAAARAGAAVIAASATSVVVNTTAVTANSQIEVTVDSSLGTRLSVTCNTQDLVTLGAPRVTARTAATSFTVSIDVGPTTNPLCFNYTITN